MFRSCHGNGFPEDFLITVFISVCFIISAELPNSFPRHFDLTFRLQVTTMSTFQNFNEEELTNISIDNFCDFNSKKFFFLSHFHADHIRGLDSQSFICYINSDKDARIYCSKISKQLIHRRINVPQEKVVEHEEGEMSINSEGEVIKVTALRAGHCPGSLMYLFQTSKNNVLFTGDFRLSSKDLERCEPLKSIKLDSVYLDTTFASRKFLKFPSRKESFERISKIIVDSNKETKDNVFIFCAAGCIGQEFLMVKLYERFGKKVYIDEEHALKYTSCIKQLANVITSNFNDTNMYFSFNLGKDIENKISNDKRIIKISPNALRFTNDELAKGPVQKIFDTKLKVHWWVAYSSHSSLEELSDFVDYLKPKKIYPITNKTSEEADEIIDAIYTTHATKRSLEPPVNHFRPNKHDMSYLLKKQWEEEQRIIKENGLDSP